MFKAITANGAGGSKLYSRHYEYALQNLPLEIDKVKTYRLDNPRALKSNHTLVKLLNSLGVGLQHEDLIFKGLVEDRAIQLGNAIGLTTASNVGRVFKNTCYGNLVTEVLVSVDDDFDVSTDWRTLVPIKPLMHPITSLNLEELNGQRTDTESGIAVIAVNIPMLAFQWKKYNEWLNINYVEDRPTMMQFLHTYPLLNALEQHVNIAIFNRWVTNYTGGTLVFNNGKLPFKVVDLHDRLDDGLDYYTSILDRRNLHFSDILGMFNILGGQTFNDIFELPDIMPLRSIVWSMYTARLPIVAFLIRVDFESGGGRNRQSINSFKRDFTYVFNSRYMAQAPEEVRRYWFPFYEEHVKMYL